MSRTGPPGGERTPHRGPCHVLMVVENFSVPADVRVWAEARTLREAGYAVSVISPAGESVDQARHETLSGISIYRYQVPTGDGPLAFFLEWSVAFWHTLRLSVLIWLRHPFAVIHAANPPDMFFLLAWLYRPLGVKYVFDQHDLSPEVFEERFAEPRRWFAPVLLRLLRRAERLSYRTADLVVSTNATFRRIAVERGGVPPASVAIVRNAPDLKRLQPGPPESESAPPGQYVLGYVGAISHQDGADYAVRALDELVHRRGRDDVHLLFVGSGAAVPRIEALVHSLQLEDHVTFVGYVPSSEVPRYLRLLDIGLSPEPLNPLNASSTLIKVMEYMAMGKPVVAFDLPETRYTLGEAGLYARPNSVEDYAARIMALLDDSTLRDRLGRAGRERVERLLHWDNSRRSLLEAYARMLGQAVRVGSGAGERDQPVEWQTK